MDTFQTKTVKKDAIMSAFRSVGEFLQGPRLSIYSTCPISDKRKGACHAEYGQLQWLEGCCPHENMVWDENAGIWSISDEH